MKNIQFRIKLIFLVGMLLLSGCGPSAEELAATETKIAEEIFATQTAAVPTATNTPLPTATNSPTPTYNRAATVRYQATQKAQSMADLVQQLYTDGNIQSPDGEFLQLDDFQQSYAKINWVGFKNTGLYLRDFILRSDIQWKTAQKGANIQYSGCGFRFGFQSDQYRYHLMLITLEGYVRFQRCIECKYIKTITKNYFGKIDYMQGEAELIMIVEGDTIQAFVNGEQIFSRPGQYKFWGSLWYAISSGTNADFGTRCSFKNTEIWKLEP